MRRPLLVSLMVAGLLLSLALPALALTSQFTAPANNTVIAGDTTVDVSIRMNCGLVTCEQPPSVVYLTLRNGSQQLGNAVSMFCVGSCNYTRSTPTHTWRQTIKPSTWPVVCNGQYDIWLGIGSNEQVQKKPVRYMQPPKPPTGVAASGEPGNASVTWTAGSEPDLIGYDVWRQTTGGSFQVLNNQPLAKTATSYVDSTITAEQMPVVYRVVALRHDGLKDGAPVAGCQDDATSGQELADAGTWSFTNSNAVAAPQPDPTGEPSDGPTDPTSPTPSGTPTVEPTPTPRPPASPAPTAPSGGKAPKVDLPGIKRSTAPRAPGAPAPRFYGEGLPFSEVLDFGEIDPVLEDELYDDELEDGVDMDNIAVDVPGSERELDLERIVVPINIGLVLLTIGFHLRRWILLS